MKSVRGFMVMFLMINIARGSLVTVKDTKTPKMVRNLSRVIYDDLSTKLTHLMNKRAELYPQARSLNSEKLDLMKTIDVHSQNPLYGYNWDEEGNFQPMYHAPHHQDEKRDPTIVPLLHDRFPERKDNGVQMECILGMQPGKMEYFAELFVNKVSFVFYSNCKKSSVVKTFILEEEVRKCMNMHLRVNGGDTFQIKYFPQHKDESGVLVLDTYKLLTYYAAKTFKLDKLKWNKIFGHNPDELEEEIPSDIKEQMDKEIQAIEEAKAKLTGKPVENQQQNQEQNPEQPQTTESRKLWQRIQRRKFGKNRKLKPEDLKVLIPGYEPEIIADDNDETEWKTCGAEEDFEIIVPNGGKKWDLEIIDRIWDSPPAVENCNFKDMDILECEL
jgi:hypothetical protein